MSTPRTRSLAVLACTGLLLAGCAGADMTAPLPATTAPTASASSDGSGTTAAPTPSSEVDVAVLVDRALDARAADDAAGFATLLSAATAACPVEDAARRLGEAAAIADRWAEALQYARPKAQAVTETQLSQLDWDSLVSACDAS